MSNRSGKSREDQQKAVAEALEMVLDGRDLTQKQAQRAMHCIMEGEATHAQIGGLLIAMRMKGETVPEITGCARAMRRQAAPIAVEGELIDTCGTGGDGTGTFNISTTSAFVVAGAGLKVAKHGNRSVSSRSGSADVLEELGVQIDLAPERVEQCIREVGIGFLFAPRFHQAMKHAIGPRRELGVRTIFNILGPLTNPARADIQLLGVYSPELTEPLAEVLGNLGVKRAFVVHGAGGLDEISLLGETKITELKNGRLDNYTITPEDFGKKRVELNSLRGGDAAENARITLAVLKGADGPQRDIVLLNAGAALAAAGKAGDIGEGVELAAGVIDSGRALGKLEKLREISSRLNKEEAV